MGSLLLATVRVTPRQGSGATLLPATIRHCPTNLQNRVRRSLQTRGERRVARTAAEFAKSPHPPATRPYGRSAVMRDRRAGEADMFRSPRAVIDGVTICARLPMPIRIGPTSSPPARIFRMLRTAAGRIGRGEDQHVGRPVKRALGKIRARNSGRARHRPSSRPRRRNRACCVQQDLQRRAHPPARTVSRLPNCECEHSATLRHDPEAADMARRADRGLGDLFGRGFGVNLGVGDEQVALGLDDQAERADRAQPVAPSTWRRSSDATGTARRCRRSGCRPRPGAP
jgi:hypothetical protein